VDTVLLILHRGNILLLQTVHIRMIMMIKIHEISDYRSVPLVNFEYDMRQVTLRMTKLEWFKLKKLMEVNGLTTNPDDE
jgi:hypothetical protein